MPHSNDLPNTQLTNRAAPPKRPKDDDGEARPRWRQPKSDMTDTMRETMRDLYREIGGRYPDAAMTPLADRVGDQIIDPLKILDEDGYALGRHKLRNDNAEFRDAAFTVVMAREGQPVKTASVSYIRDRRDFTVTTQSLPEAPVMANLQPRFAMHALRRHFG